MVIRKVLRRFRKEEDGLSLVEGLITIPLTLLIISAMIEFSFAVWQWNQTVKAMQLGARLAVVSDPLPTDAEYAALVNYGSALPGDPVPVGDDGLGGVVYDNGVTVTCGSGVTPCDETEMNRLVFGSDGTCSANYGTTKPGVCDFNPTIRAENLVISYHRNWLGYVGRPQGPVVTVTLQTTGLNFQLPFLGALLGLNRIEIPAHPVSMTSEDMNRCPGGSCS